jgi:hypothetical protein
VWAILRRSLGLLTSVQFRRMRRQLSDLDAKLRQMTAAEHERRR